MRIRYIQFIPLFLVLIFVLQGCVDVKMDTGDIIVPPRNQKIAIEGTWKVTYNKFLGNLNLRKEIESPYLGKTVMFNEDIVMFGDELYSEPKYKMKKVDSRNYFLYVHRINYKELGIIGKNVEVISVTSKDKHIYDFIRVNENRLIVYVDHIFYYLNKVSEDTEVFIGGKETGGKPLVKNEVFLKEPELQRSGILIGLRKPEQQEKNGMQVDENEKESYRTIWIAAKNKALYPVLEDENIFLPRKSGFWMIGIHRQIENGFIKDLLYAYPVKNTIEKIIAKKEYKEKLNILGEVSEISRDEELQKPVGLKENIQKSIRFVGNDYIAIEYFKYVDVNEIKIGELQVLPIDNIENDMGINISDLSGKEGQTALLNSAQAFMASLSENESAQLQKEIREDSFTLARRNGHWIMWGRLYYMKPTQYQQYRDYSINLIPPDKVVYYDDLCLSWNQIKTRVPEALDAYTSPNKDLAIIKTKNAIFVYAIEDHELSSRYLKRIELQKGETIIMAEWAVGSYVDKWNNLFDDKARVIQ